MQMNAEREVRERIPHVVIVGGGFGGLAAAKALKHTPAHVTLIDRTKHHLFQPLFYRNGLEQVTRFGPKTKIEFHGPEVKQIATNTSLISNGDKDNQ